MAIAAVNITEQDGGIGVVLPSVARRQVKLGICSLGVPNTVSEFTDSTTMEATLGTGPVVEAAAHKLRVAGGSVIVVPLNPTNPGTVSAATAAAGNTGAGTVTPSGAALDSYAGLVKIVASGAPGVATFSYSLDGGLSGQSATIQIPSAGLYLIPGTGITLTFAGAFVAGDGYTFAGTAPSAVIGDLAPAFAALYADPRLWDGVHVVGTPTSTTAALSTAAGFALAAAVDSQMAAAATKHRYVWAITELATLLTDGITPALDAQILAGLVTAGFTTTRTCVAAGDCGLLSATAAGKARTVRRNAAWPVSARISAIDEWVDPAEVDLGALQDVRSLYRDEAVTPGLDDAHLTTLRTWIGEPGYFVGNVRPVSAPTSDFQYIQHRRVMNRVDTVAYSAEIRFSSRTVRVDKTTGFINEKDARTFESTVRRALLTALPTTGPSPAVSDIVVAVDRASNILATGAEPIKVGVEPLGYPKIITSKHGFMNPLLAV